MVDIKAIHDSNEKIKDLPASPVAVFIGATSGICEEALKQFAQHAKTPRIYIIGRKAAAAAPLMDDLKQKNPNAELEFIEKDASLIRDIDAVCSTIKAKEKKLDFLFLSAGFISFVGRQGEFLSTCSTRTTLLTTTRNTRRLGRINVHALLRAHACHSKTCSLYSARRQARASSPS